jgi:hypothetical protein
MLFILLAVGALTVMMIAARIQRKGKPVTVRDRFLASMVPAMIGAGLGFAYARYTYGADALQESKMAGMYSGMGAVISILSMRVFSMLSMMFREFFGKPD